MPCREKSEVVCEAGSAERSILETNISVHEEQADQSAINQRVHGGTSERSDGEWDEAYRDGSDGLYISLVHVSSGCMWMYLSMLQW